MRVALSVLLLFVGLPASAEGLRIPQEVDLGGAGLAQFRYTCPASIACGVRCFSHGAPISDIKEATSATVTSYRSHSRQGAPDKEVQIVGRNREDDRILQISGDSACVFDRMTLIEATGFTTRIKR